MTRTRWILTMAAVAALGVLMAGRAWSAEDRPPPDGPKGPPHRDQAKPPGPPRGDIDRPPLRREGRPEAKGRRPEGPPREREGRPGPEGRRPDGPPREGGDRPHRHGPEMPLDADRPHPPGPPHGRDVDPHQRPGPRGPQGSRMHPPGGPRGPHADIERLRHNDPEMFKFIHEDNELESRTRELGMQFRQAPPEQRERIQKELHELVNKQFEIRQQRRMMELKRLEGEIQRVREATERRAKARDQIIQRRVSELLGREDDLGF